MRRLLAALRRPFSTHSRPGQNVVVHAQTATATASTSASVNVAVGTRMLLHWSDIAIEQERDARAARRLLEKAQAAGENVELGRELHPSLIAIAAASHALDALYGELRDLALPPRIAAKWKHDPRAGPPRPLKLQEALKHGFRISAQRWRAELEALFELRDGAVHPETLMGKPEQHPLGVNTAAEYLVYCCETATKAVNLLFEILETCAERPKPALEQWSNDLRPSLARLKAERLVGINH